MAAAPSTLQNNPSWSPATNNNAQLTNHATRFRRTCSTLVQEIPKVLSLPTYQQQVQRVLELKASIATLDSTTAKEATMHSTLFWALVNVNDEVEARKP